MLAIIHIFGFAPERKICELWGQKKNLCALLQSLERLLSFFYALSASRVVRYVLIKSNKELHQKTLESV